MGGHAFNNAGVPIRLVQKQEVPKILQELRELLGLEDDEIAVVGSANIKTASGDLDIAVERSRYTRDDLHDFFEKRHEKHIKVSGNFLNILYKQPDDEMYIQIDFICGNVGWLSKTLAAEPLESRFQGKHRNILLSSIATAQGFRWSPERGLSDRDLDSTIKKGDRHYVVDTFEDYGLVAKVLICEAATADDISSVPKILEAVQKHRLRAFAKLTRRAQTDFDKDGIMML